ncbi:hypothetical protein C6Q28_18705 [Burkholderia multivorans]|nr:hypothetical protein C6Q28_18705 [Burkholderia multivorans]
MLPASRGIDRRHTEVTVAARVASSALAGYGAITMANALKRTVSTLPTQLCQSLTRDRGKASGLA